MPKVSVLMPAYNAEKYIADAIDSILNQTFRDFEFIIINDGSTDQTKSIILSYDDPRIKYLENEINSGIVITLNKGLDFSNGEYIARMDADDIAVKTRLQKQVNYMDLHQDIGVLGTGLKKFGENIDESLRVFSTNPNQLKAELLFTPCIAHPTVMIRNSVLKNNDIWYQEKYAGAEDFLMWWQLAQRTKISSLPDILHYYRIHSTQITMNKGEKYRKLLDDLLQLRFADIGFEANEKQKNVFLKYCLGEYNTYAAETLKEYIGVLSAILKGNKENHFFTQRKLQELFAQSVLKCLDNSSLSREEKNDCFKFAVENGILSVFIRSKRFCYKFLNFLRGHI